jgi:hypothetical protein
MTCGLRRGSPRRRTVYPRATCIHYNSFEDNGQGLVWEGTTILNAENNWWGDPSGPRHPENPDGTGDNVSGMVDYEPWLLYYGPETSLPFVNITSPIKGYININILFTGFVEFLENRIRTIDIRLVMLLVVQFQLFF